MLILKNIVKLLSKQKVLPGVGEFKETLGQTLWWGTLVSFTMMAGTFYYTTLRFVFPWFTLPKFIVTILLGVVLIYIWEHKYGVKSLWSYRWRQAGRSDKALQIESDRPIVVAVSGGFDPLNGRGHITHIQEAKKLGDKLVVILSRDDQLITKGNKPHGTFYPSVEDRIAILRALRSIDEVVINIDDDGTCAKTLRAVRPDVFAKGGDRTPSSMPRVELEVCKEIGCQIVYRVGDPKTTSSGELVRRSTGGE